MNYCAATINRSAWMLAFCCDSKSAQQHLRFPHDGATFERKYNCSSDEDVVMGVNQVTCNWLRVMVYFLLQLQRRQVIVVSDDDEDVEETDNDVEYLYSVSRESVKWSDSCDPKRFDSASNAKVLAASRSPVVVAADAKCSDGALKVAAAMDVFKDGYAFHATGFPTCVVDDILRLPKSLPTIISGGYTQIELFSVCPLSLHIDILRHLRRLQPNVPSRWVLHQCKMLVGEPNVLEQITHVDGMQPFVSVIIHLNAAEPGDTPLYATEIGKGRLDQFPWARHEDEFHRFVAQVASVMFFLVTRLHRAPKNQSSVARRVLFCVIGPPISSLAPRFDDSRSVFEFEYARKLFGPFSKECLDSLAYYYPTHNPLNHYEPDCPQLTAKWRNRLDPDFALWTTTRMPVLLSPHTLRKSLTPSTPSVSLTRRLSVWSAQDRLFFHRAFQQALVADDMYCKDCTYNRLSLDPRAVHKVINGLFICGYDALNDLHLFKINAVVNLCPDLVHRPKLIHPRNYCSVLLPDDENDFVVFTRRVLNGGVLEFIHKRRAHGNVLVHCKEGVSRSAAVVIAYLVQFFGWSLVNAFLHLKDRRVKIRPKLGLCSQLVDLEIKLYGYTTLKDTSTLVVLSSSPSSTDEYKTPNTDRLVSQDSDTSLSFSTQTTDTFLSPPDPSPRSSSSSSHLF